MFERFTDRARQAVTIAQGEARSLCHNYIGTEHILLGLLGQRESLAAQVLNDFGLGLDLAQSEVVRIVGKGAPAQLVDGQIPFTPEAKLALEFALREALALGHNHIGTEHILLGLSRTGDVGMRIITENGIGPEMVRNDIMRRLSGTQRSGTIGTGSEGGTDRGVQQDQDDGTTEGRPQDELLREAQGRIEELERQVESLAPTRWIVERYEPEDFGSSRWVDVTIPDWREDWTPRSPNAWEAVDAGAAFHAAVIDNPDEKISSTSYRVLAYDSGITINVGVNLDAKQHERKGK